MSIFRIKKKLKALIKNVIKEILSEPQMAYELWKKTNIRPMGLEVVQYRPYDIADELYKNAVQETTKYVEAKMLDKPRYAMRTFLFDKIIPTLELGNGLMLEFGVYKAQTINYLARLRPDKVIHGFDSFEGLPEKWVVVPKGTFNLEGKLPEVEKNVILHKGWFQDTLPGFLEHYKEAVAFMHVDADLYSSCKYVLETLKQRIVPGTVIQFDEYFNYPGWQEGEFKAFQEFVNKYNIDYEYLGYVSRGYSVAVKIKSWGKECIEQDDKGRNEKKRQL